MNANKVPILVTGASSGIGQAVAKALATRGFSLILLGRNKRGLEQTQDDILSQGGDAWLYPLNLSGASPEDYVELARLIQEKWGVLRGIVHTAGRFTSLTPLAHYAPPQWYDVMQVNLHAPFLLTQACLPLLKKADKASVLFTGATQDQTGAYWGAYAVSKQALSSLAQVLALECEANTQIKVAVVTPPPSNTALRRQAFPGDLDSVSRLKDPSAEAVLKPFLTFFEPGMN